jgi:hypothetical protein
VQRLAASKLAVSDPVAGFREWPFELDLLNRQVSASHDDPRSTSMSQSPSERSPDPGRREDANEVNELGCCDFPNSGDGIRRYHHARTLRALETPVQAAIVALTASLTLRYRPQHIGTP